MGRKRSVGEGRRALLAKRKRKKENRALREKELERRAAKLGITVAQLQVEIARKEREIIEEQKRREREVRERPWRGRGWS